MADTPNDSAPPATALCTTCGKNPRHRDKHCCLECAYDMFAKVARGEPLKPPATRGKDDDQ